MDLVHASIRIRRHIVTMSSVGRTPHIGSALSCADIMTALYFGHARLDPARPDWPDRDRIILSKGHAAATLYACLAERGFIALDMLQQYAKDGSPLAEHPSYGTIPGVECTTGSLGHGLGLATGMALGVRMNQSSARVFAVLSDGECNEGSTWEAAMWAPAQDLSNLTAIVDFNGQQATGDSRRITKLEPLADKWRAFGWQVIEVDGHDLTALCEALERPRTSAPRAIIAKTIKGKGVSFMEDDIEWHYRPPDEQDLRRALAEIGEASA